MVLIFTPLVSHAQWNNHSRHRGHHQEHNNSYFWQDVERRLDRQESRISRGIDKGQLTHREMKKLKREQRHVAKQARHLKRHDYLSRSDKREMMEHLDYVGHKIKSLKHNGNHMHRERNRHRYTNRQRNYYRNDPVLSWANNNSSVGLYFRF